MLFVSETIGHATYVKENIPMDINLHAYQCYDGSIQTWATVTDHSGYEWINTPLHDTDPNATVGITIATINYTADELLDLVMGDVIELFYDITISDRSVGIVAERYANHVMFHHSHATPQLKAYQVARFQ